MKALHLIGPAPYQTNCYILISDEGHAAVIDPAPAAGEIDKVLENNGAKLSWILLTHGHFDHVYSVMDLVEEWDCPVYLDPADVKGNNLYPLELKTLEYTDGGVLRLDEIELNTWHTPGHSQGSWILECQGLMFCGDTLFARSVGRTDMEGGDSQALRASLAKIKRLPLADDTQVLPGHGPFSTLGEEKNQNPFLMF